MRCFFVSSRQPKTACFSLYHTTKWAIGGFVEAVALLARKTGLAVVTEDQDFDTLARLAPGLSVPLDDRHSPTCRRAPSRRASMLAPLSQGCPKLDTF